MRTGPGRQRDAGDDGRLPANDLTDCPGNGIIIGADRIYAHLSG
jgi:hypothetical protein